MKERFLPIGTVVMLENGEKEVMITSYCVFSKAQYMDENIENDMFEYGGCVYPEGILDTDVSIVFNHDKIKEVLFMGYETEQQKQFSDALNKNYDEVKEKFKSGQL